MTSFPWTMMKKLFFTGVAIVVPIAIACSLLLFFLRLFTAPFIGLVEPLILELLPAQERVAFFSREQIALLMSQLLLLLLLFSLTVLFGIFTRWYIGRQFVRYSEKILESIPLVRSIYKTSKDMIQTIFLGDTSAFKQVVLVPFPSSSSQTIGLVTREEISFDLEKSEKFVAVFIPTTPNPTSGYLIFYHHSQLIDLEMTIEEAFKYVISCGVVKTPFNLKKSAE